MAKKVLLIFVMFILLAALRSAAAAAETTVQAVTPPPGSAERKLIIDALRAEVERLHRIDAVFVVKYLKAHNGWAWIETAPRSADGANQYEEVSALMRKSSSKWKVAEIACAEEDNNACLGSPGYFKRLKRRFPGVPAAILPQQQ